MTEAEAEAALLALGSKIEWFHDPYPYWVVSVEDVRDVWLAEAEHREYQIYHFFEGRYECYVGDTTFTTSTVELAKAACERHYATGKWE